MKIQFDKTFRVGARAMVISIEDGFRAEQLGMPVIIKEINIYHDSTNPVHHILFEGDRDDRYYYWFCQESNLELI
jgi:hypothetical protein